MNCLDLTLYPSLTLSLVEKHVKKFGVNKGIHVSRDVYISGKWYNPWSYINDVDRKMLDKVHLLLEKYSCISISISPADGDLLFVTAFLTQNTDYHKNVLRWTHTIFKHTEDVRIIAEISPRVGKSYQLQKLPRAIHDFLHLGKPRDRETLLKVRGVGPKVADLYLLHTGNVTAAPVDRHFIKFATSLNISGKPPNATYCMKYVCGKCPLADVCLRHLAYRYLGRLAGWVQTLSYLAGRGFI